MILMVAASTALMLALTWGGVRYAWISRPIGWLVLLSLVFWALFAWRLMRAEEPFLPLSVLRNSVVRNVVISRGLGQGVLVGLTIFAPIYFEVVRHLSASEAGFVLIALLAGTMIAGQATGRSLPKLDYYKVFPLIGLPVSAAILVVFAVWPTSLPLYAMLTLLTGVGMGIGMLLPVSTVATQNAVALTEIGIATAALNFSRSLGSALVVALFGAILFGGTGEYNGVSAEALTHASGSDLVSAFRYIFVAAAVILAISAALFAAIEERPLRAVMPSRHSRADLEH